MIHCAWIKNRDQVLIRSATRLFYFFFLTIIFAFSIAAEQRTTLSFTIRGTLPWHNFLSGPTSWNEKDYENYLDWMQKRDLNLLVLHCYTGGSQRYMSYVEPMIKIEYRNVVPEAAYDTSLTSRWGYRPLKIEDFAFGTEKLFKSHLNGKAFGSDAAIMAKTLDQRYKYAQLLIQKVIQMAHKRNIRVAIGFEYGVYPPELFSIVPPDSYSLTMLPDPTHPASLEVIYRTIDDLLTTYPDLDQIWLWLQEHEVNLGKPSPELQKLMEKDSRFFSATDDKTVARGIWALTYIRSAYNYLQAKSPKTRLAISGWGGKNRLEGILDGLDKGLPKGIVFTCLNPLWGQLPQPEIFSEIAKHREVWVIPWLEGDWQLWHPQARVSFIHNHISLARKQGVQGVIAVHWRTEDIKANLEAFALFSREPDSAFSVDSFYEQYIQSEYGRVAVSELTPLMVKMDKEQWFPALTSPEYLPYDPSWGRLNEVFRNRYEEMALIVKQLKEKAPSGKFHDNLEWLESVIRCVLLLDEVSAAIEPSYQLHGRWLLNGKKSLPSDDILRCKKTIETAPIKELFTIYASRVRSKGELGTLSSMNQKLWLQYLELVDFLEEVQKN